MYFYTLTEVRFFQFNIVTRPGGLCDGLIQRVDCKGRPAKTMVDKCAFCGPVARVFYGVGQLDLFLMHFEVVHDPLEEEVAVGLIDEDTHGRKNRKQVISADWIFPLQACKMMGLLVPCPNQSKKLLEMVYGDHFLTPKRFCNVSSGEWMRRRKPKRNV